MFILATGEEGRWAPGGASRWWLHESLAALDGDLRRRGSRLLLFRGGSGKVLLDLARRGRAGRVFWNRRCEPAAARRDAAVARALREAGLEAKTFNASLLFDPDGIRTGAGGPYQVFTPFWKSCLAAPAPAAPEGAPRRIPAPARWPASDALEDLALDPRADWTRGLADAWQPGEKGAAKRLRELLDGILADYPRTRDLPDREGTSRLSPHLHFGEIGPRQIWHAVERAAASRDDRGLARATDAYLRQLGWREFARHLLVHFPHTPDRPLREAFERFRWRRDPDGLQAWQKGRTGYPMVDAGMRELWVTGWMHNRVRMIVASFLVKDLLVSWLEGARWFWDTLVDADLANNTLGWQWAGGCGADAAPFFRIFNPVSQGKKFDPEGRYVRRWVPEISALPDRWIHEPWKAPARVLEEAGVAIGEDYPAPIVDHAFARTRALGSFAAMRGRGAAKGNRAARKK